MTPELLKAIDMLLPIADLTNHVRRRAVRALADAGKLLRYQLYEAAGNTQESRTALVAWDGIKWLCKHPDLQLAEDPCELAPWVRNAIGLPVDRAELLADLRRDPLESVRWLVARCRNVYTVPEALMHAYPELVETAKAS